MGWDACGTKTIEETVAIFAKDATEHRLVDYNGDSVHKNDWKMIPQGCSWCRYEPGGLGQERGDVEEHKHYHLWLINKDQEGKPYIHLVLISQFSDGSSFREYCEAGEPFYYTCPEEYLDRVPEPEPAVPGFRADGWTWRMLVRKYAKLTRQRRKRREKREAQRRQV
jgi:hypothetical protein